MHREYASELYLRQAFSTKARGSRLGGGRSTTTTGSRALLQRGLDARPVAYVTGIPAIGVIAFI
jgi:hypothetical protein